MTPFFEHPSRHAALITELESWRGTPFLRFGSPGAKKGVRSNCVTFIEGVLSNLGAIKPVRWPQYVVTDGGAKMLSLLVLSMDTAGLRPHWMRDGRPPIKFAFPPVKELLIGDVILVSTGTKLHHLAIFAGDNTIWHSTERGRGVCTGNVHDPLIQRHAHSIWRAYE